MGSGERRFQCAKSGLWGFYKELIMWCSILAFFKLSFNFPSFLSCFRDRLLITCGGVVYRYAPVCRSFTHSCFLVRKKGGNTSTLFYGNLLGALRAFVGHIPSDLPNASFGGSRSDSPAVRQAKMFLFMLIVPDF